MLIISDKSATQSEDDKDVATEGGHWYAADGSPVYTVTGKNGKERPTTLRDARKLNLYPSVTTIIRTAASPGLQRWKDEQLLMAALTSTRLLGETDEDYISRVIDDSKAQGRAAADRGTALHGALERYIQSGGSERQGPWQEHCEAVCEAMREKGINLLTDGTAERSFAHPLGYGGKIDWSGRYAICDFKSKERLDGKKMKGYDEHVMQLKAYDIGLIPATGYSQRRLFNIFVGAEDKAVQVLEWSKEDGERGWQMYLQLLKYWQAKTGYTPKAQEA